MPADPPERVTLLAGSLEQAAHHASYGGPKTPEGWESLRDLLLEAATALRSLDPEQIAEELEAISEILYAAGDCCRQPKRRQQMWGVATGPKSTKQTHPTSEPSGRGEWLTDF